MSAIGTYLLGLLLLLFGGDSLLRGVAGFARTSGLAAATTGMLLLALVAAAPQLGVTAYAISTGALALAFGGAIGGNLASLGLALGVAALVSPLQPRMRALKLLALAAGLAAVVLALFGLGGGIPRWGGGLLVLAFLAMLVAQLRGANSESTAVQAELADFSETSTNTTQNLIRLVLGLALLFFGSRCLVQGAPGTGAMLGLDPLASGLSLVAFASVLPSVLIAGMAASNGQGSVAIGQALGACLCNTLLCVGALALAAPLPANDSRVRIALLATAVIAALLFVLFRKDARIGRREGALLACAFLAWLGVVVGGAFA
jgi:cation:H+ antiporter